MSGLYLTDKQLAHLADWAYLVVTQTMPIMDEALVRLNLPAAVVYEMLARIVPTDVDDLRAWIEEHRTKDEETS